MIFIKLATFLFCAYFLLSYESKNNKLVIVLLSYSWFNILAIIFFQDYENLFRFYWDSLNLFNLPSELGILLFLALKLIFVPIM